jgi:hypothetical protein
MALLFSIFTNLGLAAYLVYQIVGAFRLEEEALARVGLLLLWPVYEGVAWLGQIMALLVYEDFLKREDTPRPPRSTGDLFWIGGSFLLVLVFVGGLAFTTRGQWGMLLYFLVVLLNQVFLAFSDDGHRRFEGISEMVTYCFLAFIPLCLAGLVFFQAAFRLGLDQIGWHWETEYGFKDWVEQLTLVFLGACFYIGLASFFFFTRKQPERRRWDWWLERFDAGSGK